MAPLKFLPRMGFKRGLRQLRTDLRRRLPVSPRKRQGEVADEAPHWIVCFYGVDRSLAHTAWGIKRHIFRPLERAGVRVTVVAHFNRITTGPDRIHLLNPDVLWVEPQNKANVATELSLVEGTSWINPDPMLAHFKVNLMHQLHSLSRVHEVLGWTGLQKADVVAALRADLQYLDDLDVAGIQERLMSDRADLITPIWERWRGGLNDRFAFLGPRAVRPVLMRRELVGAFIERNGYIHAEQLMAMAADGLRNDFTAMRAERVRANGRVKFEFFTPRIPPFDP